MKVYIYPVLDYVCANCSYHMFAEMQEGQLVDEPRFIRTIKCVNDNCEYYDKKVILTAQEINYVHN